MKTQILRFLLILSPFIISSCSGQNTFKQNSKIDTVLIFNPKRSLPESLPTASFSFSKNAMILLSDNFYGFRLKDELFEIVKGDSLRRLLKENKSEISSERFYIYTDSSALFHDIFDIIKSLDSFGIENYRVINTQSYFDNGRTLSSMAIPVKNILPKTDSSYLILKFKNDKIIATLLNVDTTLVTIKDLDSFFETNKSKIFNEKIILDFDQNTQRELFKSVKEVLKKYFYTKFRIKTNDQ